MTGAGPRAELSELERRVLAFERDRVGHDRAKEADIRVAFDISPARYYQVLNRVIDSAAALVAEPQVVARLQRLREARVASRATRQFSGARTDSEGSEAQ